jgi:hypothetical protein
MLASIELHEVMVDLKSRLESRLEKQFFSALATKIINSIHLKKSEKDTFKKDAVMVYEQVVKYLIDW